MWYLIATTTKRLRKDAANLSGHAIAFALLLAISATNANAQQFVQETSTRFPSPNPTEYTNQLTIGDLDADGDLDIVFANGPGFSSPGTPQPVRIYLNNGNGFFTDDTVPLADGVTGLFRGVELGDVDNDGDLDMILVQDFNRLPDLLMNNGQARFNSQGSTRLPATTLSSSRAQFGDVDNDGDLDLFLVSGTSSRFTCGQYRLYINDGAGFFTDETTTMFPIGNVCNNMDCIFGDIDNDFDIDIRTASTGTANSRLYRNDGAGVFTVASVPSDSTCYSYDFGDIDGDGDLDMLGANGLPGSSREILLQNNGAGVFTNVTATQLTNANNPNVDDNDSKFFDYDNDGDLDMIVGVLSGPAERIYNNNGSGTFTLTSGLITSQADSTLDIAVGDLTGDGKLDIVTAQGESGNFQNRIYINQGPADTFPPTIVDTETLGDTMDSSGPYVVRALILDQMSSDRNFFDKGIELNYTVNAGSAQSVAMRHSGGQVYRGELPGQGFGSTIEYWVTATDFANNTGTGAMQSFQVIAGPNAPIPAVSQWGAIIMALVMSTVGSAAFRTGRRSVV